MKSDYIETKEIRMLSRMEEEKDVFMKKWTCQRL